MNNSASFTRRAALRGRGEAFTLIELLVVLAIVAILFALLMPTLVRAKDQARRVVCLNNIMQIGVSLNLYRNDYNSRYPASTNWASSSPELLLPYCHTNLLYTSQASMACPGFIVYPPAPYNIYACLMVNGNLIGGLSTSSMFHQYTEVKHPSTTFLFTHGTSTASWSVSHLDQLCDPAGYYGCLHLKGTGYNLYFVDDHAEWVRNLGPGLPTRWHRPQIDYDATWMGASELYGP